MKKLIILGSSNPNGNAKSLANTLMEKTDWEIINLNNYNFSYYDYENKNKDDDYLPLLIKIVENYDTLIFITPVYWFAMSGIMKVFFDRLTDLLTIEKELGRKLKGKKMAAISTSTGNNLGDAFWLPFSETANYLGMEFIVGSHTIPYENNSAVITQFIQHINSN